MIDLYQHADGRLAIISSEASGLGLFDALYGAQAFDVQPWMDLGSILQAARADGGVGQWQGAYEVKWPDAKWQNVDERTPRASPTSGRKRTIHHAQANS